MPALIPRQGEGRIHYPRSVALDEAGGTLAVAEAFEDRLQVFRLKPEADEVDPSARGGTEFITSHFGVDVACAEDLLALLDEETQGVALLDARNTPPIHMAIIGGSGALPMRFGKVSAIAIEPVTARVWVADSVRATVDVFDTVWDRSAPSVVDMFIPRLARSMDLRAFERRAGVPAASGAVAPGATAPEGLRTPEIADIAFLVTASAQGAASAGGSPTGAPSAPSTASPFSSRSAAGSPSRSASPLPSGTDRVSAPPRASLGASSRALTSALSAASRSDSSSAAEEAGPGGRVAAGSGDGAG
jgi:hypothetical protein